MTTVISIASGKGGVGKSSLAANFAIRLQEIAGETLLVDADLLMANAHILLGHRPDADLVDYIEGEKTLEEVVQRVPRLMSILPGRSGSSVSLEKDGDPLEDLVPQIRAMKNGFDYVVVDAPAGSGQGVLNTLSNADHVVIVLLGQATSFVDAYALIKNAFVERRVTQFSVVVNMAINQSKAQGVFDNFQSTVCGFLPVSLSLVGFVLHREAIANSSRDCRPIVLAPGEKPLIEQIDVILYRILAGARSPLPQIGVSASDRV
ncbi:P-loop NTPase [Planktotalea arctica]|uniref:P-loop NTPase n=1 Tax=Planktotalea arctica TaxID=1481893 RepID=UPI003219D7C2